MISPIPITKEILITRIESDDYSSLDDLFKDYSHSIGEDYFKPVLEGRNIQNAQKKISKSIPSAKTAAYEYGKSIVPEDLLQNYFYSHWNSSIDYYSKRTSFSRELGLNGAFQLVINGNSLNAEEFIFNHNGYLDSGFYSTSLETEDNKISLDGFDHVPLRLTRNIQKIINTTSIDTVVTMIGCSIDAFMANADVLEIGLQFYFAESLRNLQVVCSKQLSKDNFSQTIKK